MLSQQREHKRQISNMGLNPFELGMEAARAGRSVQSCPFARHGKEWVRWFSGWQNYYCQFNKKTHRGGEVAQ